MAKANRKATRTAAKPAGTAVIQRALEDIAGLALHVRILANEGHEDTTGACLVGIEALAEKIGFLADAAGRKSGGGYVNVTGTYAEWINRPELNDTRSAAEGGAA